MSDPRMMRPEDVFTEDELMLWRRLLAVVDRNPVLDPRQDGHNLDFFEVGGHIEITREGMLKIMKLARYTSEIRDVKDVEYKGDLHVTVIGRITDAQGSVEEVGGCSWSEVASRKTGRDIRIYNDVVTRAATRMEKRGVEAKVRIPFVNMLIKEVFGGFEVGRKGAIPEKHQRALPAASEPSTTVLNDILQMLKTAREAKVLTAGEMAVRWNAAPVKNPEALAEYKAKLAQEIAERRK